MTQPQPAPTTDPIRNRLATGYTHIPAAEVPDTALHDVATLLTDHDRLTTELDHLTAAYAKAKTTTASRGAEELTGLVAASTDRVEALLVERDRLNAEVVRLSSRVVELVDVADAAARGRDEAWDDLAVAKRRARRWRKRAKRMRRALARALARGQQAAARAALSALADDAAELARARPVLAAVEAWYAVDPDTGSADATDAADEALIGAVRTWLATPRAAAEPAGGPSTAPGVGTGQPVPTAGLSEAGSMGKPVIEWAEWRTAADGTRYRLGATSEPAGPPAQGDAQPPAASDTGMGPPEPAEPVSEAPAAEPPWSTIVTNLRFPLGPGQGARSVDLDRLREVVLTDRGWDALCALFATDLTAHALPPDLEDRRWVVQLLRGQAVPAEHQTGVMLAADFIDPDVTPAEYVERWYPTGEPAEASTQPPAPAGVTDSGLDQLQRNLAAALRRQPAEDLLRPGVLFAADYLDPDVTGQQWAQRWFSDPATPATPGDCPWRGTGVNAAEPCAFDAGHGGDHRGASGRVLSEPTPAPDGPVTHPAPAEPEGDNGVRAWPAELTGSSLLSVPDGCDGTATGSLDGRCHCPHHAADRAVASTARLAQAIADDAARRAPSDDWLIGVGRDVMNRIADLQSQSEPTNSRLEVFDLFTNSGRFRVSVTLVNTSDTAPVDQAAKLDATVDDAIRLTAARGDVIDAAREVVAMWKDTGAWSLSGAPNNLIYTVEKLNHLTKDPS